MKNKFALILGLFFFLFFSCSALDPDYSLKEGKYLESAIITYRQLEKDRNKKTYLNTVLKANERLKAISDVYDERYTNRDYLTKLEYFGILFLISDNSDLKLTEKMQRDLSRIDLIMQEGIDLLDDEFSKSKNDKRRLEIISKNLYVFKDAFSEVRRTPKTQRMIQIFRRRLSDIYIRLGEIYNNSQYLDDVDKAYKYYKNACDYFQDVDNEERNYKNSCTIAQEIDIKLSGLYGNKYYSDAIANYNNADFENALNYINKSLKEFSNYPNLYVNEIYRVQLKMEEIRDIGGRYFENIAYNYFINYEYYDAYINYQKAHQFRPTTHRATYMKLSYNRYQEQEKSGY